MDFGRKQGRNYAPLNINWSSVERADSFTHLGVCITEGLTWALHTDSAMRKARQSLFHLRHLRKFQISPQILRNFYSCTIESYLLYLTLLFTTYFCSLFLFYFTLIFIAQLKELTVTHVTMITPCMIICDTSTWKLHLKRESLSFVH